MDSAPVLVGRKEDAGRIDCFLDIHAVIQSVQQRDYGLRMQSTADGTGRNHGAAVFHDDDEFGWVGETIPRPRRFDGALLKSRRIGNGYAVDVDTCGPPTPRVNGMTDHGDIAPLVHRGYRVRVGTW